MSNLVGSDAERAAIDDAGDAFDTNVESIRKDHLKHEMFVRACGSFYYLTAFGFLMMGVYGLFNLYRGAIVLSDWHFFVPFGLVVILGAGSCVIARGLWKLKPWARIPTILFSVVGLLNAPIGALWHPMGLDIPIGTLFNACCLWVVLSKKGRFILSPEYATIVAASTQAKYRMPILTWIFLGILAVGALLAVVVSMYGQIS